MKVDMRFDGPGAGVAAGVGWYQWSDRRGVFVEHETVGETRESAQRDVHDLICASLRDLCGSRGVPFDEGWVGSVVESASVEDRPTTVLVAAVFKAEGWRR